MNSLCGVSVYSGLTAWHFIGASPSEVVYYTTGIIINWGILLGQNIINVLDHWVGIQRLSCVAFPYTVVSLYGILILFSWCKCIWGSIIFWIMGLEHNDQECQNALIPDWQKSCQNDRFLIGFPPWFGWAFKTGHHGNGTQWPPCMAFPYTVAPLYGILFYFPGASASEVV